MRLFLLACFCLMLPGMSLRAQTDFGVITADSIGGLVPMHMLDGACGAFHPQGALMATETGLHNLATGTQRIDISDVEDRIYGSPYFSPDGRWLVMGDSIYAVDSGTVLYQFERPDLQNVYFSDNGRYAHSYDISFDTQTWLTIDTTELPDFVLFGSYDGERRAGIDFKTGNGIPRYLSGGEAYHVQVDEGIYELSTGELILLPDDLSNPALLESGVFSPDDSLFFTGGEGLEEYLVYHVPSFELAYEMSFDAGHSGRLSIAFSPDSQYFAEQDEGVYLAETGELLFEIAGNPVFSPDSTVVGTGDGLYRLPDGEQIMAFEDGVLIQDFTLDSRLVAISPGGVFDLVTGEQNLDTGEDISEMFFSADDSLIYRRASVESAFVHNTATGAIMLPLPSGNIMLSKDERFIGLTIEDSCQVFGIPPAY